MYAPFAPKDKTFLKRDFQNNWDRVKEAYPGFGTHLAPRFCQGC